MQKWEYLVVYITDSDVQQDNPEVDVYLDVDKYTEALNKYGLAGWELVSFSSDVDGAKAAFKRPFTITNERTITTDELEEA